MEFYLFPFDENKMFKKKPISSQVSSRFSLFTCQQIKSKNSWRIISNRCWILVEKWWKIATPLQDDMKGISTGRSFIDVRKMIYRDHSIFILRNIMDLYCSLLFSWLFALQPNETLAIEQLNSSSRSYHTPSLIFFLFFNWNM